MKKILFIDRDGTIIREPEDEQIDSFEKLQFVPRTISSMAFLRQHSDYEFVMVSNQDGLGTPAFPEDTFWPVQNFIIDTLRGEGVEFDDILIDPHFPADNAPTRKPQTGLVEKYMTSPDYDIASSYVIGDRETDRQFAENIGCGFLQINHGIALYQSPMAENVLPKYDAPPRKPTSAYDWISTGTDVVTSIQDWDSSTICSNKSASMAVSTSIFMFEAICTSMSTTPSRTRHWR